ncbi:MAG: PorV/PorQ family protein [Elusimicrobia bacterium]|nr:PorV/PorQ family protein [Elusimicrobiota bacterium]
MKKLITKTTAVILALGLTAHADPGDSAAAFLRVGVGARPAAMAEAYAGVSGDLMALYSNPAGLSSILGSEFSFSHTVWLEDVSYSNLAMGMNIFDGYAALGVNYLTPGTIDKVDNAGNDMACTYKASDLLITGAYSKMFGDISAGAALKLIHSNIDNHTATAFALDVGVQRFFGMLNAGLVIQNFGTQMSFRDDCDPLPLAVRAGVSYPFLLYGLDFQAVAETYYSNEVPFAFNAGVNADYLVSDFILSLRLGFKSNAEGLDALSHLTTGLGLEYSSIVFDYAFGSFEDLGMTHRISLGYRM